MVVTEKFVFGFLKLCVAEFTDIVRKQTVCSVTYCGMRRVRVLSRGVWLSRARPQRSLFGHTRRET